MTEDQIIERIENALRASDMAYIDETVEAYARTAWNEMKAIARENAIEDAGRRLMDIIPQMYDPPPPFNGRLP